MVQVPRISVTDTEPTEASVTMQQFEQWSQEITPYLERLERSRATGGLVVAILFLITFFNIGWSASLFIHDLPIGNNFLIWTLVVFTAAVSLPYYFFTYVPNRIRAEVETITNNTFGND